MKIILQLVFVTFFIFLTLNSPIAIAKEAQVPGNVQPGQIEKQLKPPPQIPKSIERFLPTPTPREMSPTLTDNLKFIAHRFSLEHTTIYSESDLNPYFTKLLNKTISITDIQNLADELLALH